MMGSVVWRCARVGSLAIFALGCNSARVQDGAPAPSDPGAPQGEAKTGGAWGRGPRSGPGAPSSTGALVRSDITWPAEAPDEALLRSAPAAAAAAVRRSRLPVLLPPESAWIQGVSVITSPLWTSATARDSGRTITLSMRGAAQRHTHVPKTEGTHPIRKTRGFVTQNERIWSATWIENGVSYDVEVECADSADSACADEAFVRDLAEHLVFVGGAREVSP